MTEVTAVQAARELLSRRKAKESLIDFVEYTFPQYEAARHHRLLAEKLEGVARGDIKRLMVFMPPRSGKSQLASRHFPAWYVGSNPGKQLIAVSANAELAADFGRDVRNLIADPEYGNVFPGIELARDSQAANKWHTAQGGVYFAAGIGCMITGRGAHVLLIDDPVRDAEDADSASNRNRIWNWYSSAAYTRLMPEASVVLVMTRWHDDDLAGRLLNGAESWEVVKLRGVIETPAQAEEDPFSRSVGEVLWPDWFSVEDLQRQKANMIPRDWSALIQQDPISEEGAFFKREWVQYYDEEPENLVYFGASDYAVSAGKGDYTVHGICGIDEHEDIYVVDWWRDRQESDVWIDAMLDLMKRYEPRKWAEESGQILKSLGPFIERRMEERNVFGIREQFASTKDKGVRARAIQGFFARRKVYLPRNKDFTVDLVEELLKFTGNQDKRDDQVDVLSLFGRMLADLRGHVLPSPPKEYPLNYGGKVIDLLERKEQRRRYA